MRSHTEHKKLEAESSELESALSRLKESGLKLTEPRKAILTTLIHDHGPFTAEQIHKRISRRVCDLATIYRCLTSLEDAQILRRCEFGDGSARYEMAEPGLQHHHHVVCNKCKKVEIVDDSEIEDIDRFARKRGYANVSHNLEFFGLCPSCK
jgi:Fur family ferric uptake transcriptional regulator